MIFWKPAEETNEFKMLYRPNDLDWNADTEITWSHIWRVAVNVIVGLLLSLLIAALFSRCSSSFSSIQFAPPVIR